MLLYQSTIIISIVGKNIISMNKKYFDTSNLVNKKQPCASLLEMLGDTPISKKIITSHFSRQDESTI
jgi:hypothetical protein